MEKTLFYLKDSEIKKIKGYITIPIKTGSYSSYNDDGIICEELNSNIRNLFLESRIYPYTIVTLSNNSVIPDTLFFESKELCEIFKSYLFILTNMNTPKRIISLLDKYSSETSNVMIGLYTYYDRLKELERNIVHNTVDSIKVDYIIFSYTEHYYSKLLAIISYMSYDLLTEIVKINIKLSEMRYDILYKTKEDSIMDYLFSLKDLIESYNRLTNNITYYSQLQAITYKFTDDYNELYTFLLKEYNHIKAYLEILNENEKKKNRESESIINKLDCI